MGPCHNCKIQLIFTAEQPVDLRQRQSLYILSYLVLIYLASLRQTDIPTESMPSVTFYLFPRGVYPTEGQGNPGRHSGDTSIYNDSSKVTYFFMIDVTLSMVFRVTLDSNCSQLSGLTHRYTSLNSVELFKFDNMFNRPGVAGAVL